MKKTILSLTLVLAIAFAAIAFAAPIENGPNDPKGSNGPARVELTPEQQEKAQVVFDKYHDDMVNIREDIWAKQTTLEALTTSGKATKSDIVELVEDISKLRTELQTKRDAFQGELEAATGIKTGGFGRGFGGGRGSGCSGSGGGRGPGNSSGDCPGGGGCSRY